MSRPEDIPQDAWEDAHGSLAATSTSVPVEGLDFIIIQEAIARAILKAKEDERGMCLRVIDAEREWGGDLRDAAERIASGAGPRQIPGWNCPDEDGNGG